MAWSKTAIMFISKMFAYKKGSLTLLSAGTSVVMSFSLDKYISIFSRDLNIKNVLISVMIQTIMLAIFILLLTYDFLLGVRVSVKKRKELFEWDKVFDTSAKIVGIGLLTTMVMFLSITSELAGSNWLWWVATTSQCFLWILSNGFEYGSIGRHIQDLRGDKPAMFKFFDRVLEVLQNKAIQKIENSFNILEQDYNKDKENNKDENISNQ